MGVEQNFNRTFQLHVGVDGHTQGNIRSVPTHRINGLVKPNSRHCAKESSMCELDEGEGGVVCVG